MLKPKLKSPKLINLSATDSGWRPSLKPADAHDSLAFAKLWGRTDETVHNVKGAPVTIEGVLVRTYSADPYKLILEVNGQHFIADQILPETVDHLEMQEYGPSPHDIEKRKQREAEVIALNQRNAEYAKSRAEAIRANKQAAVDRVAAVHQEPGVVERFMKSIGLKKPENKE